MGRAPCCDKATVRKGPWSPEEDATLKSYIEEHGPVDNWIALPQKIGLKRCGKSCRLRWLNYLRPNIRHGGFSEEEDKIICSLYINIGSRWSIIAAQLPGRTDNDIKNYWNTKLKKKLLGKQRNRENHVRKNSSQRGGTKASSENEHFSVISGTGSDWCGVPHGVFHLPPASMNQNPNPIIDQAAIQQLLVDLGGRFSPNQEQEPVPMNTDFLRYPNDMIPPSYNPIETSMVFASSQLSGFSSNELLPTWHSMSKVDNVPVVIDNMLPDFSTDEGELRDQQSLFNWSHKGNICGTHQVTNGSICGSALSHRVGSSNIWEDISFSSLLADSELAAASQSLLGRRGTGDSSFEESRSVLGTLSGIL